MCKEWLDFEPFYMWALRSGYRDDLTLDRVDVDGNYSPENCRWITSDEQKRNTRRNLYITYNGETKCLSEWSREMGINKKTLSYRINSPNYTVEEALTLPVKGRKN